MAAITKGQISKIHVLLSQMHLLEHKPSIVLQFTGSRTEHTSEMTVMEATRLIQHLVLLSGTEQQADKMRKKVFALAYEAGIIYGSSKDDKKMNAAKINMFLKDRGAVKKDLNKLNHSELVKVVGQFEQIIKHQQQTGANKATKSLLQELNISLEK